MSDTRIQALSKRISETVPVDRARRASLINELQELRRDLDPRAREQVQRLDAAVLLMEFMSRSDELATAEGLRIVAGLVGSVDGRMVQQKPRDDTSWTQSAGSVPPSALPQPGVPYPAVPHSGGSPSAISHSSGAHSGGPHPAGGYPAVSPSADISQHADLRITDDFLLGTILVQAKIVTPQALHRALQLQFSNGQTLGQCLIMIGAATPGQIAAAVTYQDRMRERERPHAAVPMQAVEKQRAVEPPKEPEPKLELKLTAKQKGFVQSFHAQVLGEVLIRLGSISREQLDRALQLQRVANVHIGEALVQSGATSWDAIRRGLDVQRQLRRTA